MTFASVRSAAQEAAKRGTLTPHQLAALGRLDELLSDEQRREFTDLWRVQGSPAAPPPAAPAWLAPAMKIVQEFEGCRLQAYRDAANIPTIGWGATRYLPPRGAVRMGDTITQSHADELLRRDLLDLRGPGLATLLPVVAGWAPNRIAALVSWSYNVGLGAVEESTLRRRILAGENPATVVAAELPRWNKADGKPLEGLARRRAAEVALFLGAAAPPAKPVKLTPSAPFSFKITPHITYGELTLQQEARRFTAQHQCDTALKLCQFLEEARAKFGGKPIVITSGNRPPAVNAAVGGARNSEHLYNAPGVGAVDFYIAGADINEVQSWADRAWPYSLGYGAPKGFIHLGIRQGSPRVRWNY